ncbi:uncharacterized protein LOC108094739 [Drosophila ficusphila]|uniref:uncharacterized protein LOC108094739 n=1 Tax=Drosophila ficusphila TaxID=30025 RepID=UPI0007E71430|nr:uncharacterized protein LOC108094739 [Drosophila ficusphila]
MPVYRTRLIYEFASGWQENGNEDEDVELAALEEISNGKTETESGSQRGKWKWQENSNHKLGIYLRSVNDYHLKCARLPPKNQLLEKAQPTWGVG